ncbi:hypothetical protein M433DRAFT_191516 [Acidomyces richmondensis BFW]|nr:hypothetical protein M433DRAFT_191516 [Acidomyces richmondensis BFW]
MSAWYSFNPRWFGNFTSGPRLSDTPIRTIQLAKAYCSCSGRGTLSDLIIFSPAQSACAHEGVAGYFAAGANKERHPDETTKIPEKYMFDRPHHMDNLARMPHFSRRNPAERFAHRLPCACEQSGRRDPPHSRRFEFSFGVIPAIISERCDAFAEFIKMACLAIYERVSGLKMTVLQTTEHHIELLAGAEKFRVPTPQGF